MWYMGIDPGQKGGIAFRDESDLYIKPYSNENMIWAAKMAQGTPGVCCLEKVHSMPGQGVKSTFAFGAGFGYIQGVLESFKVPYQLVRPQDWKKEFGLNSDKQKSVEVCKRLFPDVNLLATLRSRVPHDGMAEALLMSEYARRRL